ncbi:MAG: leucine-rich repeat protein [Clostridia bacterium]|nr:leucine-rich repeat protein [Clostridia bacterium]
MVFKCKMCGGALEILPDTTIVRCSYCDTPQTIPRLSDERRANLYDRAGHFRRNNEFDKAAGIYENILAEDPSDAEAYWSLVLCGYGIEYVEDPATKRRLPTVNRAQYTSVFDDENYKAALANADSRQRALYEAEGKAINKIQRDILEISQKEEPFDVFICYKETDQGGRRTPDSVLAQELYYQLKQEGFRVFFSRITLEDKLGSAYEPYIFAALQSAKAMVVLGTKPAHFNAAWVKNEWSRYLALIKGGANKVLIPAYRDMDPYDLPDEFSHLQAQDMAKLGFMQDLVRGIKKIVGSATQKEAPTATQAPVGQTVINIKPMLERAFLLLEDGDFDKAVDLCEQVLNQDPKNAKAYLAELLAELRLRTPEELAHCAVSFAQSGNYQKALRFGDDTLKQQLTAYCKQQAAYAEELRQKEEDEALEWQLNQAMRDIARNANPAYALDDAEALLRRLRALPSKPFVTRLIPVCEKKVASLKEHLRLAEERQQQMAKRAKRIRLIVVIALLSLVLIGAVSFLIYDAVTYETVDGVKYIKKDDGYYALKAESTVIGALTIPSEIDGTPVVGIEGAAFSGCTTLTSVTVPNSVTTIGFQAFEGCSNLESITLPFVGLSADESFYTGFGYIFGANTWADHDLVPTSLKTVIITGGTSINSYAFYNCKNLQSVTIPDSVTSIGDRAFEGCHSLQSVTFGPNSRLTSIGSYAFCACFNLQSITIPDSVTTIGVNAFWGVQQSAVDGLSSK